MSAYRNGWQPTERRRWTGAFVPLLVAMGVWVFATPLFTGPDEVSQARRATAVVRGELTGRPVREGPPLLLEVEVPPLYGDPAEQNWLCHLGPLVDGAPQEAMLLPSPPCPDLVAGGVRSEGRESVAAETVQYRGQPFFYALVGVPTLIDQGQAGAYWMRLVGAIVTAALLASAIRTVALSNRRPLAAAGLLVCLTPGVLYLGGSTNPSAVEIAAALSAWTAVAVLATSDTSQVAEPLTGRLVRRLGLALVVLALCRGLGPAFAAAVVSIGAVAAGGPLVRVLTRRRDVRIWGAALAASFVVSGVWLAFIAREYPLPERAGSGFATALGWLPWYLQQSVGVFGTNDSAVAPAAVVLWCLVAVAVVAAGVTLGLRGRASGSHRHLPLSPVGPAAHASHATTASPLESARSLDSDLPFRAGSDSTVATRTAFLGLATLIGGLLMNVTAEGLSLPPIGFFWQGRYALPLALGGVILASTSRSPGEPDAHHRSRRAGRAANVVGAVLVVVHVHALWRVTGHLGLEEARTSASAFYAIALLMVVESATGLRLTRLQRPG